MQILEYVYRRNIENLLNLKDFIKHYNFSLLLIIIQGFFIITLFYCRLNDLAIIFSSLECFNLILSIIIIHQVNKLTSPCLMKNGKFYVNKKLTDIGETY